MKAVFFIALVALALASATLSESQYEFLFTRFVDQYSKNYEVSTFFAKYNTFKSNLNQVLAHNAQGKSFTLAINEFGDLSQAEFKAKYLKLKPLNNYYAKSFMQADLSGVQVPNADSFDWRNVGAVTPVKNQGQCGSCWAFSTTGSTEAAYAIKKKKAAVGLSEQQLVDCSQAQGNQGCEGGLMDQAFQYIIANKGIDSEADYAYTAQDGTCNQTKAKKKAATISSYTDVPAGDEVALAQAATLGPVSVAVEADQSCFQFYSGGVLSDPSCGTQLDHGVLVTGYDHDASSGLDYWVVKNSWGADWGLNGYLWIERGTNECGIASVNSYPVV
jgi:C1A family cysteine protease